MYCAVHICQISDKPNNSRVCVVHICWDKYKQASGYTHQYDCMWLMGEHKYVQLDHCNASTAENLNKLILLEDWRIWALCSHTNKKSQICIKMTETSTFLIPDRHWMYKVTFWHVDVINFVIEMQKCTLCIVELHVKSTTWKYLVLHSNACFYGIFMLPATIKCNSIFVWGAQYFCLILTKYWFSWQIFMKVPSVKFQRNLSSGSCSDIGRKMDDKA